MRAHLVVAAVLLAACSAPDPMDAPELLAYLDERCPHVVVRDGVELRAALDEAAREAWVESAAHEDRVVRKMLGCETSPAVRLYLVGVDAPIEHWEGAGVGGYEGFALADDFALLYVPRDTSGAVTRARMRAGALRHELAHVHARRLGLAGPKWFNEGLAQEIEEGALLDGHWRAGIFPPRLSRARALARSGVASRLVNWTAGERYDATALEELYALSHSLVRFLLERNPGPDLAERVRAVLATNPLAIEPSWIEWQKSLDAVELLANAAHSSDPATRREASAALPILAEARVDEVLSRRADELAFARLGDAEFAADAACFLAYFRADAALASDLERMASSALPLDRLVAQVLHARRREPIDLGAAQAALAQLPAASRDSLLPVLVLIPGLR